jgi:hypothetical protein
MDVITTAFERIATFFKPLWLGFWVAAAVLFVANVISMGKVDPDVRSLILLGAMWCGGFAIVTQWFGPDPGSGDANDNALSSARRHGKPMQSYITVISLCYFIFLAVATISHVRPAG